MPVAVGYIRKSSIKEGERTYSIQTQHEAIERVCGECDYTLSHVYQDAAEGMNFSGMYEDNRPDWLQMQADIARGGIEAVVVYAIDRLSRNTEHMLKFISLLKKHNVALLSYREPGLEFASAAGELQIAIMAAVGSFEAKRGSERVRAMIRKRQSDGHYWGFTPFGYDRTEDGELVPNADADTVRLFVDEYINGASLRDLEHHAITNGLTIASPVAGYRRHAIPMRSIHVILSNHWLYRGFIAPGLAVSHNNDVRRVHDEANPPPGLIKTDKVAPILSEAQAAAVAEALRRRSRSGPKSRSGTSRGLLTGIIYCYYCHKRMYVRVSTVGHKYYNPYYYHDKFNCPGGFSSVRQDVVEQAVIAQLANIRLDESQLATIKSILRERQAQQDSNVVDVEQQKSRVREAIKRLNNMYQWNTIEATEYLAERQKLEMRLTELQQLNEPNGVYDIEALAAEIQRLSTQLSTGIDAETQRQIILDIIERIEVEKTEDGWRFHIIPTPAWSWFWKDINESRKILSDRLKQA